MPKRVDFYRLARPVQERFSAATRRTAPPAPILFRSAPRTRVWGALGASGVMVLIALLVLKVGWGDVTSRVALHGPKMLALDVVVWGAATYGVLHAMALLRTVDTLPFAPGLYLFPACAVEAFGPVLRVWPIGDVMAVEVVTAPQAGLSLRWREGQVLVPAPSLDDAQRAERALTARREELARALALDDPHVLAEMDPLHDSALSNPLGASTPMKYAVPAWARLDWAIAIVLGVVFGVALGLVRNMVSDQAMMRAIVAAPSIGSYEQYLALGGRQSAEVRDVLLPRAQLQVADAQGTDAVVAFARAHPGSAIQTEIDAAVHRHMLSELDTAKKAGTLAALDVFAKTYPDNGLTTELKAARHVLYAQALAAWKKKAQADAATSAFMDRLVAAVEKAASPACEIRFRQRPSKTMDDADKKIQKSGHYPGPDALPSHYMTTDALRTREQRVEADIAKGFAAELPADVLSVQPGAPVDPDAPAPSQIPTLLVEYSPEWSHNDTVSLVPATVFANINFAFEVSFLLPDGSPPLTLKTKAWRGADLWKMKAGDLSRQDFEQVVYDNMIDGAFDQLDKKLSDTFF